MSGRHSADAWPRIDEPASGVGHDHLGDINRLPLDRIEAFLRPHPDVAVTIGCNELGNNAAVPIAAIRSMRILLVARSTAVELVEQITSA